jgi:hypothetical protein
VEASDAAVRADGDVDALGRVFVSRPSRRVHGVAERPAGRPPAIHDQRRPRILGVSAPQRRLTGGDLGRPHADCLLIRCVGHVTLLWVASSPRASIAPARPAVIARTGHPARWPGRASRG